jgi:hypothetical protein
MRKFSCCERNWFHKWDFSSMPVENITEIATYAVPKIPRFPIKFGQTACKFSWACNHNGKWSGISFHLWKVRKDTALSGRMEEHFTASRTTIILKYSLT